MTTEETAAAISVPVFALAPGKLRRLGPALLGSACPGVLV